MLLYAVIRPGRVSAPELRAGDLLEGRFRANVSIADLRPSALQIPCALIGANPVSKSCLLQVLVDHSLAPCNPTLDGFAVFSRRAASYR